MRPPASPTAGLQLVLGRRYKYLRLEWNPELAMLRVRTCVYWRSGFTNAH